jgi:UDP-N-acetylmuramyl pentapeptide phosphotransferase/UDP-N-acetylglucosamine-1-phosphate transferase
MILLLSAFFPSLLLGWLILRFRGHHESLTADNETGPQKIHVAPVPRVGGLMIYVGFLCGIGYLVARELMTAAQGLAVIACTLPAFAAGFFEDLTKHGGVLFRLFATFLAAGLAFWLLGARLDRLDFPGVDEALRNVWLSCAFTMFAAAGVSQSVNIIDGLNGLAAFVGLIILSAIGLVAWRLGDSLVLSICLASLGGLAGFFLWNFPRGLIFCGDGGAYFIGFVIAEVSVLIVHRHAAVSAWFPLILAAYPVWETLFSIYRRKLVSGKSAMRPDALHFHSLVYRWISRYYAVHGQRIPPWRRNALAAAVCAILPLFSAAIAVTYWDETWKLSSGALVFAAVYVLAYRELARPANWRRLRRPRRAPRVTALDAHVAPALD